MHLAKTDSFNVSAFYMKRPDKKDGHDFQVGKRNIRSYFKALIQDHILSRGFSALAPWMDRPYSILASLRFLQN